MPNNLTFLSVLTPAASAGDITFQIQTYDASTNATLTLVATGITITDSEAAIANKIKTQLDTQLVQYHANYVGVASYGTDVPPALFRLGRTDHIVSIFSESQFSFEILTDTTGGMNYIQNIPVLVTISKARTWGLFEEQPFEDEDDNALTNQQMADLLCMGSAKFVNITNNYIVQSTFVHTEWGFYTKGIQLKKYPVFSMDGPRIRRPNILSSVVIDNTQDLASKYTLDNENGWVMFRFAQEMLLNYEPFDMGNEIKISYVGGYKQIPIDIQQAVVKLTSVIQNDVDIKSLKAGSFAVEFRPDVIVLGDIFLELKKYFRSEGV